jgi:hypothetical protein
MYNKKLFILIIIIIILTTIFYIFNYKIKEEYANYSDYSKKYILDDCKEGWAKDYIQANPSTTFNSNDLCLSNAYVKESKYLCGICGSSNDSPLYAINSPLKNNTIYYGCGINTSNSIQLNWGQNGTQALPSNVSDIKTCNSQNVDISPFNVNTLKSDLYLYVVCDDTSTIYLNDVKIKECPGWNTLHTIYIPNVYAYDKLKIVGLNTGGPGGLCLSYRWNNKLYILDNNGFENSANVMKYTVDNLRSFDKLWNPYCTALNKLPPWMQNWIRFDDGNGKTITFETFVGNSKNNYNEIKSDLVLYVACDDSCSIYLNDIKIKDFSGWNTLNTLTIPNVYIYDTLKIVGLNTGGPGGLSLSYKWNNKLYILDNNINNNSAMVMNYSVDNLRSWDKLWAQYLTGSNTLPLWMINWMRFDDGNGKTITFQTFVGVSTNST